MQPRDIETYNRDARLSVSEDTFGDSAPGPMLLFVPRAHTAVGRTRHYHIALTHEGAQDLLSWLQGWLKGK